jgi:hypothetical protein
MTLIPSSFKKKFPCNALFLREATFVNAARHAVGLAGSENRRTFASAIGKNGAAEGRSVTNGRSALYIAA